MSVFSNILICGFAFCAAIQIDRGNGSGKLFGAEDDAAPVEAGNVEGELVAVENGPKFEVPQQSFDAIDQNKDGKLSRAEFQQATAALEKTLSETEEKTCLQKVGDAVAEIIPRSISPWAADEDDTEKELPSTPAAIQKALEETLQRVEALETENELEKLEKDEDSSSSNDGDTTNVEIALVNIDADDCCYCCTCKVFSRMYAKVEALRNGIW